MALMQHAILKITSKKKEENYISEELVTTFQLSFPPCVSLWYYWWCCCHKDSVSNMANVLYNCPKQNTTGKILFWPRSQCYEGRIKHLVVLIGGQVWLFTDQVERMRFFNDSGPGGKRKQNSAGEETLTKPGALHQVNPCLLTPVLPQFLSLHRLCLIHQHGSFSFAV